MSEWISIKDELPEYSEGMSTRVLVYPRTLQVENSWPVHRDVVEYGHYRSDLRRHGFYIDAGYLTDVTHWQPLPEPPEAKS